MARPKDDADKLHRNRDERRNLIDAIDRAPDSDFDELSEVTRPDIRIELTGVQRSAPSPEHQPLAAHASGEPYRARQQSSGALGEALGTIDKLPNHHRLWAFLALVLAALIAYLASRGIWGVPR